MFTTESNGEKDYKYFNIVRNLSISFRFKPSELKTLFGSNEYQLDVPFLTDNIKKCISEKYGLELDNKALAKIICQKIAFFSIDKDKDPDNRRHVIHQMISSKELLAYKNAAEKSNDKFFIFDTGGGQIDFSCRQNCSEEMNEILKGLNDVFKEYIDECGFVFVEISPNKEMSKISEEEYKKLNNKEKNIYNERRIPITEYNELSDDGKEKYLEEIAESRRETITLREGEGAVDGRKEEIKSFVKNIYDSGLNFKTLYFPQIF